MDIIQKTKQLKLPKNDFVVVGGGVLVALGLLEWDDDIDICVTPRLFDAFKAQGWRTEAWQDKTVLKYDVFDAGIGFGPWSLKQLQSDAIVIDGVSFISLGKLLEWKQSMGRPKDIAHISLIKKYQQSFAAMLMEGGTRNSLGKVNDIIATVLHDPSRLPELYDCLTHPHAWARMRAADSLEKICRQQPQWIMPYADDLLRLAQTSSQPSILWHTAQMCRQLPLTTTQQHLTATWIKTLLSTSNNDWIVTVQAMETLTHFVHTGLIAPSDALPLLKLQTHHASPAVVKKAHTFTATLAKY